MPMPPEEAVTAFVALPSPEFPSDHLLVAADVRFVVAGQKSEEKKEAQ